MSDQVKIELSEGAKEILRHVTDMPNSMLVDIAKGMQKANVMLVSRIQMERLTGQGPFPVEEHKLGVRSGRLLGSLHAGDVTIADNRVESSIGSNVKYAAIHEFGGTIHREASVGSVRLKTINKRGTLARQEGFPHLAVFAGKGVKKRFKTVRWSADAHDVVMPERAPVRTGIPCHLAEYGQMVSQAIEDSWEKLKGENGA